MWLWVGRGKGWRDGAGKLNEIGMSEMMDVEMKVVRCQSQSLHRRMEQYNVNLFTSNTRSWDSDWVI